MKTNILFQFFSIYVWPVMRLFIKKTPRCKHCILSAKQGPLQNGLCTLCRQTKISDQSSKLKRNPEKSMRLFNERIQSFTKGTGYHALLLLSGGKDSAYMLNRMKLEFPELKILAVLVNNGFTSPFAEQSAKYISEKLNVDFVTVNSYVPEFKKVIRQAFLKLKGQGSSGAIDHADGTLIFKIGQQMAIDLKIPLLLGGLSPVQVKDIVGIDGFELNENNQVIQIFPLAAWNSGETEVRATVQNLKLMPAGYDSPLVSNSSLIVAMSVLDVMNLGYSSFEPELAKMIREGKAERKQWLYTFEQLEFAVRKGFMKKDLEKTLRNLELKIQDVVGG